MATTPATELTYGEALNRAQALIGEAVKILAVEPAAMQFFSILELQPINNQEVQMRLNTRDGGSTVYLEYNPIWMCRIDDPSILAYFFYSEVIRIALHHCTTRRALPAQSQYLASNLLCFEDQRLLSKWRTEVKNILSTIPTHQQIQPILGPLGFVKDKDWFLERLKAYIEKAMNMNKEQKLQEEMKQAAQKRKNKAGQKPDDKDGKGGQGKGDKPEDGQQGKDQQGEGQGDKDQQDQQNQQGQGQGEGQGQDQDQNQNGEGQGQGDGQGDQQSDGQGGGNGDGQGDADDGESDPDVRGNNTGNGSASDCAKACQEYFDSSESHARTQTANWGENTMVDEEVQSIAQHIAKNPEMWGNMPGKLQELIIACNKSKFDPTKIVKHFKQEVQSELFEQSRSKANRRNEDLSGWRHKMKASMGFFTDVSGSMSDDDVAMGQAFMTNFIKHTELYYADWDASCGEIRRIKRDPLKKGQMEVLGRGGTDPQCILEKLKEEKMKLGGIVVFTDCYFSWPRPASKWVNKIFIISTADGGQPPEWCRFFLNIKDIREWYDRQH